MLQALPSPSLTEGTRGGDSTYSFLPWAPLLSPKHTKYVSLDRSFMSKSFFRSIANGPPMEKLIALDVSMDAVSSPYFIEAMSKCISLTNLSLAAPAFGLAPATPSESDAADIAKLLDSGALPHLQTLKAHHLHALPFVRRRSLTRLHIFPCMSSALTADLFTELIPNQPRLATLDLTLSNFTVPLLTSVLEGLQSIEAINLNVEGNIPNDLVNAVSTLGLGLDFS